MKNCLLLIIIFFGLNIKAQDLREEIKLNSSDFRVYDINSNEKDSDVTKYQIIDSKGNKLEHIARIFDKKLNKETFLGIYRKNDSEIHFIEFNQTQETPTLDHYVYIPDVNGKLVLAKKEVDLKDYPADLPPKFKNNKPIHPEFVGGDAELNKWVEKNITPILKKELSLMEQEMERTKRLGYERQWQIQYSRYQYLHPLVAGLEEQANG